MKMATERVAETSESFAYTTRVQSNLQNSIKEELEAVDTGGEANHFGAEIQVYKCSLNICDNVVMPTGRGDSPSSEVILYKALDFAGFETGLRSEKYMMSNMLSPQTSCDHQGVTEDRQILGKEPPVLLQSNMDTQGDTPDIHKNISFDCKGSNLDNQTLNAAIPSKPCVLGSANVSVTEDPVTESPKVVCGVAQLKDDSATNTIRDILKCARDRLKSNLHSMYRNGTAKELNDKIDLKDGLQHSSQGLLPSTLETGDVLSSKKFVFEKVKDTCQNSEPRCVLSEKLEKLNTKEIVEPKLMRTLKVNLGYRCDSLEFLLEKGHSIPLSSRKRSAPSVPGLKSKRLKTTKEFFYDSKKKLKDNGLGTDNAKWRSCVNIKLEAESNMIPKTGAKVNQIGIGFCVSPTHAEESKEMLGGEESKTDVLEDKSVFERGIQKYDSTSKKAGNQGGHYSLKASKPSTKTPLLSRKEVDGGISPLPQILPAACSGRSSTENEEISVKERIFSIRAKLKENVSNLLIDQPDIITNEIYQDSAAGSTPLSSNKESILSSSNFAATKDPSQVIKPVIDSIKKEKIEVPKVVHKSDSKQFALGQGKGHCSPLTMSRQYGGGAAVCTMETSNSNKENPSKQIQLEENSNLNANVISHLNMLAKRLGSNLYLCSPVNSEAKSIIMGSQEGSKMQSKMIRVDYDKSKAKSCTRPLSNDSDLKEEASDHSNPPILTEMSRSGSCGSLVDSSHPGGKMQSGTSCDLVLEQPPVLHTYLLDS